MTGNQQVVRADQASGARKGVTNVAVVDTRLGVEWQNVEVEAEGVEFPGVAFDPSRMCDAETQLCIRDRGYTDVPCIRLKPLFQGHVAFVDEIDAQVRIQHEHQGISSRSSRLGWARGGRQPRDLEAKYAPQSLPRGLSVS